MGDRLGLTREAIFAAEDLKKECVDVPEWGGCVYVHEMSATEFSAFNAPQDEEGGGIRAMIRGVAASVRDEKGRPLFTAPEDLEALGGKSLDVLKRVHEVVLRVNGITAEADEAAVGNSGAAPSDSSSSD